MEKSKTCCFIGNRRLPKDKIEHIVKRLNRELDRLISQGVTEFISGAALGFDKIAVSLILAKKEMGHDIRLIFALPCRNQDELWSAEQKKLYRGLLAEADEIIYVSEENANGCTKKCNRYMVDRSGYCICAQLYPTGEIALMVRYARIKRLKIFNICK